jgi:hypothetical protein
MASGATEFESSIASWRRLSFGGKERTNQRQVLASEEYIIVEQISRDLEHAQITEVRLDSRKLRWAISFYECFKPRFRRPDLSKQATYRVNIFDVKVILRVALEDLLDIGSCE